MSTAKNTKPSRRQGWRGRATGTSGCVPRHSLSPPSSTAAPLLTQSAPDPRGREINKTVSICDYLRLSQVTGNYMQPEKSCCISLPVHPLTSFLIFPCSMHANHSGSFAKEPAEMQISAIIRDYKRLYAISGRQMGCRPWAGNEPCPSLRAPPPPCLICMPMMAEAPLS